MITFAINGISEDEVRDWCIEYLSRKGYNIIDTKAAEWEYPKEICSRLGITSRCLCLSLKKRTCPEPTDIVRGDKKRLLCIKSNNELDKFLTRNNEKQI